MATESDGKLQPNIQPPTPRTLLLLSHHCANLCKREMADTTTGSRCSAQVLHRSHPKACQASISYKEVSQQNNDARALLLFSTTVLTGRENAPHITKIKTMLLLPHPLHASCQRTALAASLSHPTQHLFPAPHLCDEAEHARREHKGPQHLAEHGCGGDGGVGKDTVAGVPGQRRGHCSSGGVGVLHREGEVCCSWAVQVQGRCL